MEPNQKKANGLALIPFAVFVGGYPGHRNYLECDGC